MREAALAETDGVHPIVPGKPADSEVWRRLIEKDPDDMMPPSTGMGGTGGSTGTGGRGGPGGTTGMTGAGGVGGRGATSTAPLLPAMPIGTLTKGIGRVH